MAKIAAIKDERIINEVKAVQGEQPETKEWTPDKQARLIWNLFKTNPKLQAAFKKAGLSKEDNLEAFKQWLADWNNGRLAYPSNTARSLAEAKLAKTPDKTEEFSANADELK